ncbi:MAG: metal ABC transporter permease [Bacteroidaceae bacterium]|nr:metal ABC transporter permease [Bacteroidaceae bacterium]
MFDLIQYPFFQNALIACLLSGIVCGLVGTYIVSRRMVFVAGGMAHASLGGVGICALAGWPPIAGAATFALLTGWGVQRLSRRREIRSDSAIAMLWALGMGIAIICSYMAPEFLPNLSSYLFGNILLINTTDLWLLGGLAAVVTTVFALCMQQIITISFDPSFAKAQHQPVRLMEWLMMTLTALSIVAALKVAGIVLVISLLSVPQITANLFCRCMHSMSAWSVVIATAGCLGGLLASTWLNVPCGAMTVVVLILIYIICRTIKIFFES